MKKVSILIFAIGIFFNAISQIPSVPSKMEFAGMELSISNAARADIQETVNRIHANTTFFHRMVAQADIYFPVIEAEFAKTQFPDQIKFLCIQESAFKPEAVSTSNAVGYWQFKEATAIEQGLMVDKHIDERKNIASSSSAAAKYISAHNKALNNWVYAVIAYNTGLGGVKQFYDPNHANVSKMDIDKDTHWYFLKFLAHVIAYQDFVGKNTPAFKLQVYTQTSGKSVKDFADEHAMSVEDLVPYNLWINEHKKITEDKNIPVIVPIAYEGFVQAENPKTEEKPEKPVRVEPAPVSITQVPQSDKKVEIALDISAAPKENLRYSVNGIPAITAIEGDNSSRLALKGGIEREKFLKYNEMKSFEKLVPGQTYFLKKKKTKTHALYHVAQYDETAWSISQHYGIKEKSLRSKNRMSKYETVQPGRVIWLNSIRPEEVPIEYKEVEKPKAKTNIQKTETKKEPIKETKVAYETIDTTKAMEIKPDEPKPKYIHWVQPQEDLAMIAHLYQVSSKEIVEWNKLKSDSVIVGMKLNIFESALNAKIIRDTILDKSIEEINLENQKNEVEKTIKSEPKVETTKVETKVKEEIIEVKNVSYKEIIIEPGTTLYGLSREYKVSAEEIMQLNNLTSNSLNAGDKILIPIYTVSKVENSTTKNYVVQQGDTYYSISKKLGVSAEEIKAKNNKTDNSLKIGEVLKY